MELRRLDHVGIVVADLDAHTRQLEAMGLTLGRSSETDLSVARYYSCGDASVELIEARGEASRTERLGEAAARIEHIAFEVDDLEEVRDLLRSRGVEVTWPPYRSGPNLMIWTEAATSGGVQYQFLVPAGDAA
jgi:catechol 2,3-dioxygenase-like lactoylglutathione lyase family enzyme